MSSPLARLARLVAQAWRSAAERRRVAASRTVLHVGRRRGGSGVRYRAWFADAARFERIAAPVTSFAWSLECFAEAHRLHGAPACFELEPITPAEVEEFRRRFAPTRDEAVALRSRDARG